MFGFYLTLCFSNWVPQRGVRCSERRKCVMAEGFLLAVLNLCVRIKIRVAVFDSDHSVTDSTQAINRSFNPEASCFCSQVSQHSSPLTRVDVSGETIRLSVSLRLAVDLFLHVMCIKYKQMLVFKSIFDLLWTGRGSSVSAVAFFGGFRELKWFEKHGFAWFQVVWSAVTCRNLIKNLSVLFFSQCLTP